MNSLRPGSVAVSHQSALVLHQLPQWALDLSEVQLSRLDERRHSGPVAGVRYHRGRLSSADLTERDGLPVTTLARAVLETACTTSFEAAVVIVDAALRDHGLGERELLRLLGLTAFWPGSPTARSAIGFGDGRSESVGESRLRVLMYNHGLPRPVLQVCTTTRTASSPGSTSTFRSTRRLSSSTACSSTPGIPDVLTREKAREDAACSGSAGRPDHLVRPRSSVPGRARIRAAFAAHAVPPDTHPRHHPHRLLTIEGLTPEVVGSAAEFAGHPHFRGDP